ncbi:hypothetical protein AVEN_86489-1 [Araneus ventricosus]|uniref:Uncharacterized protein n=1 Tax=Araneus ventricosus TaxID=182803 RepID=A0A4Y2UR45_ARAVE|nr:hypothetical protein AVEN_86489-1 [Araneus ventricosus]
MNHGYCLTYHSDSVEPNAEGLFLVYSFILKLHLSQTRNRTEISIRIFLSHLSSIHAKVLFSGKEVKLGGVITFVLEIESPRRRRGGAIRFRFHTPGVSGTCRPVTGTDIRRARLSSVEYL